jgi:Fuc2NAc and GlcNAc transferase
LDIPNNRSSHVIPTPRGGGIAIVITWFIGLTYFYFKNQIDKDLFFSLLAGIPLVLIGILDDIFNIKYTIRLIIQIFCAAAALFLLGGKLSFNLGFYVIHSVWILSPIAFILIIWFINLFNFLDGIDGYIGSEVVFIGITSSLLSGNSIGFLLAASTLGFLFWNWQKAKIFMGDVGSTFLGFNIAIIALYQQNLGACSAVQWFILTSVFWFDATYTVLRRFKNRETLSQAHKKHAYQRIVQAGYSHQTTVLGAMALNIICFGLAWLEGQYSMYKLIFLGIDVLILYLVLKWIDKKKPFEYNSLKK